MTIRLRAITPVGEFASEQIGDDLSDVKAIADLIKQGAQYVSFSDNNGDEVILPKGVVQNSVFVFVKD